jgi:hypothetical protein
MVINKEAANGSTTPSINGERGTTGASKGETNNRFAPSDDPWVQQAKQMVDTVTLVAGLNAPLQNLAKETLKSIRSDDLGIDSKEQYSGILTGLKKIQDGNNQVINNVIQIANKTLTTSIDEHCESNQLALSLDNDEQTEAAFVKVKTETESVDKPVPSPDTHIIKDLDKGTDIISKDKVEIITEDENELPTLLGVSFGIDHIRPDQRVRLDGPHKCQQGDQLIVLPQGEAFNADVDKNRNDIRVTTVGFKNALIYEGSEKLPAGRYTAYIVRKNGDAFKVAG